MGLTKLLGKMVNKKMKGDRKQEEAVEQAVPGSESLSNSVISMYAHTISGHYLTIRDMQLVAAGAGRTVSKTWQSLGNVPRTWGYEH